MARIINLAWTIVFSVALAACPAFAQENWTQFLGTHGDGHADSTNLPIRWSEAENVVWKTAIHDRGWSSPVIWGDHIWMSTATADGKQNFAICVNKETGEIVHDIKLFDIESPNAIHEVNSYASPTPVVADGRVFINFGTYGTACLDAETGEKLWTRTDLNCFHYRGPGSSPIVYDNKLIMIFDGYDVQFMVALNTQNGDIIWRQDRDINYQTDDGDRMKAFATPQIIEVNGQPQLIANASRAMVSYNPADGKEIWRILHPGYSTANRPVFDGELLFINTGYDRPEIHAVRVDGQVGDVTATNVVWKNRSNVPNKPSQVLLDGLFYMVNDRGVVTCLDAKSGDVVWTQRLGGNFSASPLVAGGRIYFASQEGLVTVIHGGREYNVIAQNQLDDGFMASPAVSGDALFLRTRTHLYRIENPATP